MKKLIKTLRLKRLEPEGGYFRQTYLSSKTLSVGNGNQKRSLCSAIYYLVTHSDFSRLHRITSTEIFHFYQGAPCELFMIFKDGTSKSITLGGDPLKGQFHQFVVPPQTWQGLRIIRPKPNAYALLGTTVSPGFDFADFTLGERRKLIARYPRLASKIRAFTDPQSLRDASNQC